MPINEIIVSELLTKINNIESYLQPKPLQDFADRAAKYIEEIENEGRRNTAGGYRRSLNAFLKFTPCGELTKSAILNFYDYTRRRCSEDCAKAYCVDLRALYNHLTRNEENAAQPFKCLRLRRQLYRKPRALSIEQIKRIYNAENLTGKADFARRAFLISFCLCGVNVCDLWTMQPPKDNILHYYRQKTKDRREDGAEQFLKVPPVVATIAAPMVAKSGAFWLNWHKIPEKNVLKKINQGLKILAKKLNLPPELSSYWARHSWATIARNDFKIDIFDIAECLNHTPPQNKIDFVYIKRDKMKASRTNENIINQIFNDCTAAEIPTAV